MSASIRKSSSRSHVSKELQDKLDRRLERIEGAEALLDNDDGNENALVTGAGRSVRSFSREREERARSFSRDREDAGRRVSNFSIADTPPPTPNADKSPTRRRSSLTALCGATYGTPVALNADGSPTVCASPSPFFSPPVVDDADAAGSSASASATALDDDDGSDFSEEEEPLEYFMLTFASSLEGSQVAALLEKVRRYEERHREEKGILKDELDDLKLRLINNFANGDASAASAPVIPSVEGPSEPLPRGGVEAAWLRRCSMVEASVQCSMVETPAVESPPCSETAHVEPPKKELRACVESAVQCSIFNESNENESTSAPLPVARPRRSRCVPFCASLLVAIVFLCIAALGHIAAQRQISLLMTNVANLDTPATQQQMSSLFTNLANVDRPTARNHMSLLFASLSNFVKPRDVEAGACTCAGSFLDSAPVMSCTTESQGTTNALAAAKLRSIVDVERERLQAASAGELSELQARFQAQLLERDESAANVSAVFEGERKQLHASAAQDHEALLAQVQELKDAAAKRTSEVAAERKQLEAVAAKEQKQSEAAATKLREELQAQVQELKAGAAKLSSNFEIEREQFRQNTTLEHASMQSKCQEQLEEQSNIAADKSSTSINEQGKLLSAAKADGKALQARVQQLEIESAKNVSLFAAELENLRQNATQERSELESRLQLQLEEKDETLANISAVLKEAETEREELRVIAAKDSEAVVIRLQAQAQELEAVAAKNASQFEAEREQLRSDALSEQAEMKARFQKQLTECEDAATNRSLIFEAEKLQLLQESKNASIADQAVLQARVQELDEMAAKRASDAVVALEELRSNASLELAALQSRCQSQEQELQDTLRNQSANCTAKLEDFQSSASLERAALQAQFDEQMKAKGKQTTEEICTAATGLGEDLHKNCSTWAQAGKCEASPEIMHVVCKASCRSKRFDKALGTGWALDPTAKSNLACCCDFNEFCVEWAEQGMCEENKEFMLIKCQHSCGACNTRSSVSR